MNPEKKRMIYFIFTFLLVIGTSTGIFIFINEGNNPIEDEIETQVYFEVLTFIPDSLKYYFFQTYYNRSEPPTSIEIWSYPETERNSLGELYPKLFLTLNLTSSFNSTYIVQERLKLQLKSVYIAKISNASKLYGYTYIEINKTLPSQKMTLYNIDGPIEDEDREIEIELFFEVLITVPDGLEDSYFTHYYTSPEPPTSIEIWEYSNSSGEIIKTLFLTLNLYTNDNFTYFAQKNLTLSSKNAYMAKISGVESSYLSLYGYTYRLLNKALSSQNITLYNMWVASDWKPVIYLYHENGEIFNESLSVSFPMGFATTTIPEVQLGRKITWDDFRVFPESEILYQGEIYPYLFYESVLIGFNIRQFNRGLIIQKEGANWKVDNFTVNNLAQYLNNELLELGLYDSEVQDFTDYWINEYQLFSNDGTYLLRQVPIEVINEIFPIDVTHEYTQTRVFFTLEYLPMGQTYPELLPLSPVLSQGELSDSQFILHEWGLIF